MKKILALLLTAVMLVTLTACADPEADTVADKDSSAATTNSGNTDPTGKDTTTSSAEPVHIEMKVKDFGTIQLELYPDIAPITVENFVSLANEGFYDGLTFHRVYSGFMIQGGDPKGNGTGGSDKTIKGEFSKNGVENNLSHTRGVISMARSQAMDSASSQFFIVHQDSTFLDGQYAAFGKVTDGMDVVDAITTVEVDWNSYKTEKTVPTEKIIIESVKVVD